MINNGNSVVRGDDYIKTNTVPIEKILARAKLQHGQLMKNISEMSKEASNLEARFPIYAADDCKNWGVVCEPHCCSIHNCPLL